jgi:hypothetical protein
MDFTVFGAIPAINFSVATADAVASFALFRYKRHRSNRKHRCKRHCSRYKRHGWTR